MSGKKAFFDSLYSFFELMTLKAYRHPWLAANFVLSRPPHASLYLDIAEKSQPKPFSCKAGISGLARYYWNNFRALASFVKQWLCWRKGGRHVVGVADELIIVDSPLFIERAVETGRLDIENFFPGLEEALRNGDLKYVVAPGLHGIPSRENLEALTSQRRADGGEYVFPFDLFSSFDCVRLLLFWLFYPLVMGLSLAMLGKGDLRVRLLTRECFDSLGSNVISTYCRYLFGRKLARLGKRIRVLSWSENRASDKMFCRGLRTGSAQMEIIGCQLYVFPEQYLGLYYNAADIRYGFSPDRTVLNGPGYRERSQALPSIVGQALRYTELYRFNVPAPERSSLLILFPYHLDIMRKMAEVLAKVDLSIFEKVVVRLHPSRPLDEWRHILPEGSVPAKGGLYENLAEASIVVGSETGALVEAIACGVPALQINTLGALSCKYIPKLGKGEVWFEGETPPDIEVLVRKALNVSDETRRHYAFEYKNQFFSPPDPGSLLGSFGLL